MDAAPLLRSIRLFESLADDDLKALADKLSRRHCSAGELIFAQGDIANAMYIVESGDVSHSLPP